MAKGIKEQLDQLSRQVDENAPLSPQPVLGEVAARGQEAAGLVRDVVAEYADQLAHIVRGQPITAVLVTFFGAYFLGRLARWL